MSRDRKERKSGPPERKSGAKTNECSRCHGFKPPTRRMEERCELCEKWFGGVVPNLNISPIYEEVESHVLSNLAGQYFDKQRRFMEAYRGAMEAYRGDFQKIADLYGQVGSTVPEDHENTTTPDWTPPRKPYVNSDAKKRPMVTREEYEAARKVLDSLDPGFYVKCANCGGWFTGSKEFLSTDNGPVCRDGCV